MYTQTVDAKNLGNTPSGCPVLIKKGRATFFLKLRNTSEKLKHRKFHLRK